MPTGLAAGAGTIWVTSTGEDYVTRIQASSVGLGLNDSIPVELNFRRYRRLAMPGHFNADIPLAALARGVNTIEIQGRFEDGIVARQVVSLARLSGSSPLPARR